MKYKPLIIGIGFIGFMIICSWLFSGSVNSEIRTAVLNAKRECTSTRDAGITSVAISKPLFSQNTITYPNAKRENVSKTVKNISVL